MGRNQQLSRDSLLFLPPTSDTHGDASVWTMKAVWGQIWATSGLTASPPLTKDWDCVT